MVGLDDSTQMSARELTLKQVVDRVNTISKAGMAAWWRFRKVPYTKERSPPAVSPRSPFFAMSELFFRPDETRERLLLAIEQIRDGPRAQVLADERADSDGEESFVENMEPAKT